MRRHEALIPLSRFHRKILFAAQLLKRDNVPFKGFPADPEGKRLYIQQFYSQELKGHFHLEEQILFPFASERESTLKLLLEELRKERQNLHLKISELTATTSLEEDLNALGFALESHIRKEERILFQQIQAALSEEEMIELGKILKKCT